MPEKQLEDTNSDIDDILLINYIKDSFDIIVKNLLEEKANIYNEERDNTRQEYETLLIKYEADIREHIKIEHQMKLYIDSLETEKEELKYKNKLKKIKIEQLTQKLNNMKINTEEEDKSLIILQDNTSSSHDSKTENESVSQVGKFRKFEEEILELQKTVEKYKEQNNNLSNNIKKINEEYNKEINEIKDIKNKYKKEIKLLKKQLLLSENQIKHMNEINTYNNISNNNNNIISKNTQPKKNIFKTQSNNSIHVSNDISLHRIPQNNKKIMDLSTLLNKTTTLRKNQSSLSATSSIDKIEKYLKRKYSTLKSQKTHKIPQAIKIKKKDKNNSMTNNKKKAEDLMKLFLNDSSHLNLTERIKGSKIVQKSDDNSAYFNKYCNNKNRIKNKKRILNESSSSIMLKKARANLAKKSFKNNLFEMINNINNINIFSNNPKQTHYNMYYKSNNNNNCSFNNVYETDMVKQYNNSACNINAKKNYKKMNNNNI